jgi:hypothetical protein
VASYLGKISAIVSANTAGYVRGLNEAAAKTRDFAKTVQSDINRASRDADRSLKSILTPLQQFQRSLNAAVSERLAFKGVDGIVTGIGQLQTKLRELQRQGSRTVDVALNISGRATVDQLIEDLDVLDDRKVQAVIEAVNTESINRAKAQLEQLYSVANEIAQPLAAAARRFEQLGLSVQASFIPALNVAQTAVQELEAKIREGGRVSQGEFDRVAKVVDRTTAAIRRLAEAQELVNALPTGQELRFRSPRVSQTLTAARQSAERAASLPASTIESAGVASLVTQLQQAAQYTLELQTRVESLEARGLVEDAASATRQLENATEVVRRLKSQLDSIGNVQAASGRLNILQDLSDPPTAATRLPQGFLQRRAESTARQEIGAGVDPAIRQFRQLASQVQSVRSQIDALPATIGSEFAPRLREAEQAFVRLRTSGRATAEEIENASNEVQQLAAQVRRVSQTQGIASFADGLDDTALRGALGNLQALQQILNRVGATAGSDGARQFDRLRAAIQRATREGTVGSEAFQRELRQITQDAAAAAAATGRIGQSAAFREIRRGGDIARGGLDKLSLATQQAAFAIDDFFSATGDFTQKIRAVQNNVTQLAFILGNTTGLFIGLGVSIAAQAAVALFNFLNETEKAKFGLEFLNDELQKSKSLAEQNADAFRDLADAVAQAGSGFGANATRFQIDETLRQQREARREQAEQNIVQTNPRIIAAEAEVRRLEQRLEDAATTSERAAAASELGRARQNASVTRRSVLSDAGLSRFDGDDVQRSLQRARDAERIALENASQTRNLFTDFFGTNQQSQVDDARRLSATPAVTPSSAREAADLVDEQIRSLSDALSQTSSIDQFFNIGDAREIRDQIDRLSEDLGRLEFLADTQLGETFNNIARASLIARAEIEGTLQGLSSLGVDADITSPLADEIASQAEALRQAQRDAQDAADRRDPEAAEAAQRRASDATRELEKTFQKIDDLARRVSLGAEVSLGQRLKGALDQVGDLGPSIVETSLRRAQAELEQIDRQRQRAVIAGDDATVAQLDQQRAALRGQTTGLEESVIALRSFQSAVEEAGLALTETLVREARQAAEQARTEANRAVGEGRFDAVDAQQQAEEARQRRAEAEARRVEVENQIRQERLRLEQDAEAGVGDERNAELARRIREGRRRAQDATLSAEQREAARADAAIAQSELDRRFANDPAIRAIREDADRAQQEEFRRQQDARRSRERAGSRASALDSEFGTLGRIAADLGDLEGLQQLQQLEESIAAVRDALESSADAQSGASDAVRAELDRLEREAEQTRRRIIEQSIAAQQDVLGGFESQTRAAEQQLASAGVGISGVQGDLVRARTLRESLVSRRDAITGTSEEDQNRRERLQQEIDAIDEWSQELNASAIAIAGFQQAAEAAALSLQRTVTSERERAADQSRRQANEAEAVFGPNSPLAREARSRQQREEQAAQDAQAAQLEADRELANQRAEFERELEQNPNSPAARRAERIAELDRIAADEARTTKEREAARAESRRLLAEQQAEFEQRPGVRAARRQADEADISLQQRRSADRAFERSRTERQRQEREAAGIAGDLRNLFDQDNIVNPNEQRDLVNATVRNEAQRVAPLLVGFAEQRQNAILQGPSRAALQAQDVTTTQGAAELNRLLRGDDSARDVNLVELKKQTAQLDQVIRAIEGATGVIATVDS